MHTPIPWPAPSPTEIDDLYWLAISAASPSELRISGAVLATVEWVRGTARGPITGRNDRPVRSEHATVGWAAAMIATDERNRSLDLAGECQRLGIEYWPVRGSYPPEWAIGVDATLCWFRRGTVRREPRQDPPMRLPTRRDDGAVCTTDALYSAATEAEPYRFRITEDRVALPRAGLFGGGEASSSLAIRRSVSGWGIGSTSWLLDTHPAGSRVQPDTSGQEAQ